ncbi:MAG: hypothetical protein JXR94_02230 [Candidatus Hydrogenedentes bacterium]|nr:hypothetical protein [Candidatus Hydrogenedentota bacterium]
MNETPNDSWLDELLAVAAAGRPDAAAPAFCGHGGHPDAVDERIWAFLAGAVDDEEAFLAETLDCPFCLHRFRCIASAMAATREGWSLERIAAASPAFAALVQRRARRQPSLAQVVVALARGAVSIVSAAGCGTQGLVPALAVRGDGEPAPAPGAYFTAFLGDTELRVEIVGNRGACDVRVTFAPPSAAGMRVALLNPALEVLELVDPVHEQVEFKDVGPGRYSLEVARTQAGKERVDLLIQAADAPGQGAGPA